jgi:hypothetical protein
MAILSIKEKAVMLVRAKLLWSRGNFPHESEAEVFHVLLNTGTRGLKNPLNLTRMALDVIEKQQKCEVPGPLSVFKQALEGCGDDRRPRAADGGGGGVCQLSESCAMRVGNAVQVRSRDRASQILCGSALLSVGDLVVDSGLPMVHVRRGGSGGSGVPGGRPEGGGESESLCAVFVRTLVDKASATSADSVLHFLQVGSRPCVDVRKLQLGRRSSNSLSRRPFQSHFESRKQLAEAHGAELRNLGLATGNAPADGSIIREHAVTPLWTAGQSVAEHGGVRATLLSLRI